MENTSALAGGLGDLRRFSPKPRLELSSLDAHLIAKRLAAQIWTCQPSSTGATLLVGE
eukprot:COSAG02_NODE_2626_length_8396_cov_3.050741_1_plen_58_part_00